MEELSSLLFVSALCAGTACVQEDYQTATDSAGVLANYRFFFNQWNGVEFNYGWAPGTQNCLYFRGPAEVRADPDEVTASYVFRYPGLRLKPFGKLGTGALVFDPINPTGPAAVQARGVFAWGACGS